MSPSGQAALARTSTPQQRPITDSHWNSRVLSQRHDSRALHSSRGGSVTESVTGTGSQRQVVGLGVDVSVGAGSGSSSPLDGIADGIAVAGPSAGISTFGVGRGTTGGDGVRSDERVADWATGGGADGRPASRSPASTDRATRPASIRPPPTRGAPRARLGRPLGDDRATPTRPLTTDGASECRYSTSSVGHGCRVSQSARTTS